MKIKMTTIREIDGRDFDDWVSAVPGLSRAGAAQLKATGKFEHESEDISPYTFRMTRAKTIYEVLES